MSKEIYPVEIRQDVANQKYDAWLGDQLVGLVVYGRARSRYVLTHAAVLPEFQHHGVGYQLISQTLDDIRSQGSTVTIICPVVREFIDRYPEYEDVIDRAEPGIKSRRPATAPTRA
jgi:predicted GNAT family acetyltransferase